MREYHLQSVNIYSWNPAGALKAGRNPAVYKDEDKIINVPGKCFWMCLEVKLQCSFNNSSIMLNFQGMNFSALQPLFGFQTFQLLP